MQIEAALSRKTRHRERNGRPQRMTEAQRERAMVEVVINQPHRRGLKNPMDTRGECELGRLFSQELIDLHQFRAGEEWRRCVGKMRWAIACPPDRPAQMRLLKTFGMDHEPTPDESRRARSEYDDAYYAVALSGVTTRPPVYGPTLHKILAAVVVRDEACQNVDLLKIALNGLVKHWDLTNERKSRIVSLAL